MDEKRLAKKLQELTNNMLLNMRYVMEAHNQEVLNALQSYNKSKERDMKTVKNEMFTLKRSCALMQEAQEQSHENH
jgi:hypothetical protein